MARQETETSRRISLFSPRFPQGRSGGEVVINVKWRKAAFETMHYLIVVIAAIVIGTVTAVIADAIEHVRWVSVLLGLAAGAVTFVLGATKTSLDIIDKWLDIRKKKRDEAKSNAKVIAPTEEQIKAYGGVVYRQVTRKAHEIVNQRERIESTVDVVVNVQEETSTDEPESK